MIKAMLACVLTALAATTFSDEQTAKDRIAAEHFVQAFYDWYVPKANKLAGDPVREALQLKSRAFSPALRTALLEDIAAQDKAGGEIVGLDFDPFLNSQDPDERYVVVSAKAKGKNWRVFVHGVAPGASHQTSAVVAVIEKGEKGWRFVNFEYPGGGDLQSLLRLLKKDRDSATRKGR